MSAVGEIFRIKALLNDHIARVVREIFEKKHLYQRVDLRLGEVAAHELSKLEHDFRVSVGSEVRRAIESTWFAGSSPTAVEEELPSPLSISLHTARLFCVRCDNVEPFKSLFFADILRPAFGLYSHVKHPQAVVVQTFAISLACQGCGEATIPEVFLLMRIREHLQLCGRAPMEQYPAIDGVPKDDQKLLGSSRIAHGSGQTLAGIALLRCFLEQYARKQTKSAEQGDRLMAAYQAALPIDFPSQFRVFVALYSDLSAALHSANGSADVFEVALERTLDHFTARKLFKVPHLLVADA
jgi:hypothetical protein